MISIDGSYGEGGGQILRTVVALSILSKLPVHISNIRANRPNTGIKPQHYTAISLLKELSNATTEGLEIGSSSLSFTPGTMKSGRFHFDVGTAGSIPLISQTVIPLALHIKEPLEIFLRGGTDVKWAPSWDYLTYVFLPLLNQCGIRVDCLLLKRGYYPKGGGEASFKIYPCKDLRGFIFDAPAIFGKVEGIIHLGTLPDHIGKRMKHQIIKDLLKENIQTEISIDIQQTLSSGTGITLWTRADKKIIGCCKLGEKGVSAEKVAQSAVSDLLRDISKGACLDEHLFDQIVMYLVLAKGRSVCLVRSLSSHARTTMWVLEQFFPGKKLFYIENSHGLVRVEIQGVG